MPEFVPTHTPTLNDLDSFTRGYLECAEFTDCHCDNPELEQAEGFAPEFIAQAKQDCEDFQKRYADKLARYYEITGRPEDHGGHDFWLTRNGHGAGFWGRGRDPVLDELSEASRIYGNVDLYAGDDGLIYAG